MKVTGFTIVRNAIKYDYPVAEAIRSVLPICDRFVVAVGQSDDGTRELIELIAPEKIHIVDTLWNDSLREGGRVLADETNKALAAIDPDTDWAFYIQADEVLHEQYHQVVRQAMQQHLANKRVDGLLFNYLHFFGSYDYVGASTQWYRREIRVVRPAAQVYSYKDAQGFRKGDNRKLRVKHIDAAIYHYGWVRPPEKMMAKQKNFARLYASDAEVAQRYAASEFDYSQIDALSRFHGTHPQVMQHRIASKNWQFDHDLSHTNYSAKERFKQWVERLTGYRLWEYKNYIRLR